MKSIINQYNQEVPGRPLTYICSIVGLITETNKIHQKLGHKVVNKYNLGHFISLDNSKRFFNENKCKMVRTSNQVTGREPRNKQENPAVWDRKWGAS